MEIPALGGDALLAPPHLWSPQPESAAGPGAGIDSVGHRENSSTFIAPLLPEPEM